jgi:hypothetical protein
VLLNAVDTENAHFLRQLDHPMDGRLFELRQDPSCMSSAHLRRIAYRLSLQCRRPKVHFDSRPGSLKPNEWTHSIRQSNVGMNSNRILFVGRNDAIDAIECFPCRKAFMKASDGQFSVLVSLHSINVPHKREIFTLAAFCVSDLSISTTSCLHGFRALQAYIDGHIIANAY